MLLTAVFIKGDEKALKRDVAAFEAKLKELEAAAKHGFVAASKREGKKLTVKILAAGAPPAAKGAAKSAGWGPGARSARDVAADVKKEVGGWGAKK